MKIFSRILLIIIFLMIFIAISNLVYGQLPNTELTEIPPIKIEGSKIDIQTLFIIALNIAIYWAGSGIKKLTAIFNSIAEGITELIKMLSDLKKDFEEIKTKINKN